MTEKKQIKKIEIKVEIYMKLTKRAVTVQKINVYQLIIGNLKEKLGKYRNQLKQKYDKLKMLKYANTS